MTSQRKPCTYDSDYRRCPEIFRTFVCGTALYQHCGRYHALARTDRDRARGFKTIEVMLQEDREMKEGINE